jgi:hypothetical protein
MEIFTIGNGQKDEFGAPCPELVLLAVPNIREYYNISLRKFNSPRLRMWVCACFARTVKNAGSIYGQKALAGQMYLSGCLYKA